MGITFREGFWNDMKRKVMMLVGIMTILIVMLLCYGTALAESGNIGGMDWDLTDGVLTLGKEGETQTLVANASNASYWPWYNYRNDITSVVCAGDLVWQGQLHSMFSGCQMSEIDFSDVDVSGVTGLSNFFSSCSKLTSVDLSAWNITSNLVNASDLCRNCSSVESVNLAGWNTVNVTRIDGLCYGCSKLVSLTTTGWDTSNVTDMGEMFYADGKLMNLDVDQWNTSKVTDMAYMFYIVPASNLDLSNWDVSSVTRMNCMFYGSNVETLNISGWNPLSVTDFNSMFYNCQKLSALDVTNFNTTSAINMNSMFCGCKKLASLDVSGFNTSNVTGMSGMFKNCESLLELDLSNFDTSHVTNMSEMFLHCFSLESITFSTSFDTSRVTNMSRLFDGCVVLSSLDVSGWDTSNVTNMSRVFAVCRKLQDPLDVSGWDTSNVTNMSQMFAECSLITTLDVSNWNTSNVTNMGGSGYSGTTSVHGMFAYCSNLLSLNTSGWDTSRVTDMHGMFYECNSLMSVDTANWNTENVNSMYCMFADCYALQEIDVSSWNTSRVTDMSRVFYGCDKVSTLDVSSFDTSLVQYMSGMFGNCHSLVELDVSGFDTSSVMGMEYMFGGCRNLSVIDISGFNTSKVTTMKEMFLGCQAVTVLDVSGFNTSLVTNMESMFSSCEKLTAVDLSNFDTSKVKSLGYIFSGDSSLQYVILGEDFSFFGDNIGDVYKQGKLSMPPETLDNVSYTQKWIREDGTAGPYTPEELRDNYTPAMAGKWVWEKVPTKYNITFVCTEDGYLGEMPRVTVEVAEDYELPGNVFRVFGYEFEYWTDGTRRTWVDKAIIPANTYQANAEVTLTAVFEPRDRSINMQDGSFGFSIKGNEKALFQPIPASTSYQVYEQTPFGWNLIKQSNNVGEIMPDEESEVLFLNKYDPLKVTIRFAGTKLMDESVADSDSFNFLLYEDETLIDIASVSEGGAIEFQPIEYDVAGDHQYYIREVIGSDNTVEYDTHVEEIMVSITSDGVGHLRANVTMDEDEILFENKSKPGMLALRKLNATTEDRDGVFYYEVQFSTENGQPYDLLSSDISYEEREGEVSEFPEAQQIEKPKYTVTVLHMAKTNGITPRTLASNEMTFSAGDVITLTGYDHLADTGHAGREYCLESVDAGFIKMADGTWKGVMPNHDLTVHLVYGQYARYVVRGLWNADPSVTKPVLSVILYANGEQYIVNDHYTVGEECVFDMCPVYDTDGNVITYTSEMPEVEGYYISSSPGAEYGRNFGITFGLTGQVIWDDFDNTYGWRPADVTIRLSQNESTRMFSGVTADNNWQYECSYYYDDDDYPITLTSVLTSPAVHAYRAYDYSRDETVDKYDLKIKLINKQVGGQLIWVDNNNSAGLRPESVTVTVLRNNTVFVTRDMNASNNWMQVTWAPVYDGNNQLYEYEIQVDDIPGYRVEIDGNNITATLAIATINAAVWQSSVNDDAWTSTKPLRSATSFSRNVTFESVDELPDGAKKIDTNVTSCSIYFWMEGTNAYWWSDADIVYFPEWSSHLFYRCSSLTSLDLTGFDTSNVLSMNNLFGYCSGLTFLDLSGFDTSRVERMSYMFANCTQLEAVDITGLDARNVIEMQYMFQGCKNLVFLDLSTCNTGRAEHMNNMFAGCTNLTQLDLSGFDTSRVKYMQNMFQGCSSLKSLDVTGFNTGKVTDMRYMFAECTRLGSLNVSNFDTSCVTTMQSMFYDCDAMTSIDVSGFETPALINMSFMFSSCDSLVSVNFGTMDTSHVTDMGRLFILCPSLVEVDLSGFNTSNVRTTYWMFDECSSLRTIYVSDLWDLSNGTDTDRMFYKCYSLVGGAGTRYASPHDDADYAHVDGGEENPGYFTYKAPPVQP